MFITDTLLRAFIAHEPTDADCELSDDTDVSFIQSLHHIQHQRNVCMNLKKALSVCSVAYDNPQ